MAVNNYNQFVSGIENRFKAAISGENKAEDIKAAVAGLMEEVWATIPNNGSKPSDEDKNYKYPEPNSKPHDKHRKKKRCETVAPIQTGHFTC